MRCVAPLVHRNKCATATTLGEIAVGTCRCVALRARNPDTAELQNDSSLSDTGVSNCHRNMAEVGREIGLGRPPVGQTVSLTWWHTPSVDLEIAMPGKAQV